MKKVIIAAALAAFSAGYAVPVVTSDVAAAAKCKKGYYYDSDRGRCVRSRGSH